MSTGKKLFMGSISRTVLVVAQVAIGFFMMPFLLAHLGSRWYGIWTVLSSLVAYFYMMDVGLGQAVQLYCARHIATKDYDRVNTVINTSLAIYGVISILILLVTAILVSTVDHFVGHSGDTSLIAVVLLVLGVNIALEFPTNAFAGIIGAYARFDLLSYSRMVMLTITTASTFYFVGKGYGILALAVIALVCGQMSNLSFLLISKYCFPQMRIGLRWFDRSQVRELANYSAWAMLTSLSNLFKFKVQPLVIAFFSGPIMVTHYVVGSRLADYFRELLFQATNLTMPILAQYHMLEQNDEIREKLRFLTKINTVLSAFGGGVIIIVGQAFINRWLGSEFIDAYPVLVVLVLAMMVEVMIDPARLTMAAMGKVRFVGVLEMVEALFNVGLTVILVQTYGIVGAALGTAIPLLLLKLFVVPRVLCREIQMAPELLYRSMLPAVLVTGLYLLLYGWVVIHYFSPSSFLGIFTAAALALPGYIPIAFLLFEKHEIGIIRRLLPA